MTHAAVIDAERAAAMGLKIRMLEPDDELWQAYSMRMAFQSPESRLYETRTASLIA